MKNNSRKNFVNRLFSFVLCFAVLSSAFSASAQTRRTSQTVKTSTSKNSTPSKTATNKQSSQNCNGGWSGVVTYEKRLKYNEDFGKQKRLPHGTTHNKLSHDYTYTGRIMVDGSKGTSYLKTNSQLSLNDIRRRWTRSDQMDTCFYDGKKESVPQWTEKTESDITNAFGEGEAGFSMNVDELGGTYYFSFIFPEAKGTNERTYDKTAGGWCNPGFNEPENKTTKSPEKVSGLGADITDQKIDPDNPDVLSGTKTWEEDTTLKSSKFVYKITWSFKRCPAPLELEAVEFDENPLPDWNKWRKVDGETIDGNRVRVRARVVNYSNETKFPKLNFRETRADMELPGSETTISIAPGETREVEYIWDTSGFAWEIGAQQASERHVKVQMTEPTSPTKNLTGDILILPRPVILVHGLWADHTAWNGYDGYLRQAHSSSWKSYAVGENPANGVMKTGEKGSSKPSNSIAQNGVELDKQIRFARKEKNAWHVDIVAHSMGGLISRYYIQNIMDVVPDGKPTVTRLIQLGTPNEGSPCAYLIDFAFWVSRQQTKAIQELTPAFMERFNRGIVDRRGTKFSVLVGTAVPQTCQSSIWGDGVVEIPSARWKIRDFRYVKAVHTSLTNQQYFYSFVLPRLGVSHRGNHNPDPTNYGALFNDDDFQNSPFVKASFNQTDEGKPELPANLKVETAKQVVLQAGQTAEIEIPVTAGSNSGITFAAAPKVSATLINDKGAIVGKNLAGTPEANTDFRGIPIENVSANGVWKLRLENTGTNEANVVIAAWTDSSPNRLKFGIEAGKITDGKVALTAKLSDNNSPISGASVKAQIVSEDGKVYELTLLDDGAHGDGAAGDGVYGAATEKLADGDYSVTAKAETAGQMLVAAESFNIGATPNASAVKKAKK